MDTFLLVPLVTLGLLTTNPAPRYPPSPPEGPRNTKLLGGAPCTVGTVTAQTLTFRYYRLVTHFNYLVRGDCVEAVHRFYRNGSVWACVTATPKYGPPARGWIDTRWVTWTNSVPLPDNAHCDIEAWDSTRIPRQHACIITNGAGADLRTGPNDAAALLTDVEGGPHLVPGQTIAWETAPGPVWTDAEPVNGFIWVVRKFGTHNARGWIRQDDALCGNESYPGPH